MLARLRLKPKVPLRRKTEASWTVIESKPSARNSANSYGNKPKCCNHEPSVQQPTSTFWSMRSDKRSFTKCAINSPMRTRQGERLRKQLRVLSFRTAFSREEPAVLCSGNSACQALVRVHHGEGGLDHPTIPAPPLRAFRRVAPALPRQGS